MKFGILACSSVAERRFLPALAASGRAHLARIGSREPSKARRLAERFGCARFGTYEDLLADPEVQAVYVSTPPSEHQVWAERAIRAGKHVLVEKPAFPSLAVARGVVGQARAKGVRLMEGYMFSHHPQHQHVAELMARGTLGASRLFHGEFTYPRPAEGDIRHKPELLGGVFFDSAGYLVAAARLVLRREPIAVSCRLIREPGQPVECAVSLTMDFPDGIVASGFAGFGLPYGSTYTVLAEGGRVKVHRAYSVPSDQPCRLSVVNDSVQEIEFPAVDQFRLMIDSFSDGNGRFEQELLKQHAALDAAWVSANRGSDRVAVEEIEI